MHQYMQIVLAFTFFVFHGLTGYTQILSPVKWSYSVEIQGEKEIKVTYKAKIDKGWYVYSQFQESDDGPIPTEIVYEEAKGFNTVGNASEKGNRIAGFDPFFDMEVVKFSETYSIVQTFSILDPQQKIVGYLTYQTCDDQKCLPPTDFEFSILPAQYLEAGTSSSSEKKEESNPILTAEEEKGEKEGILSPLKWEASILSLKENTYQISAKANIQEGWNVYSAFTEGEDGPIPTSLYFDEGNHFKLNPDLSEQSAHMKKEFDAFFDMDLVKIKKEVTLSQSFVVVDPSQPITGFIEYQTCDDKSCLPPVEVFFIFDPEAQTLYLGPNQDGSAMIEKTEIQEEDLQLYNFAPVDLDNPKSNCGIEIQTSDTKNKGMATIFFLGFIGGLLALLTPCVFPMIPLTVSFFTKSAENKKKGITHAALYGFFILLVYLLLSIPFHLLDSVNPDILNDISTNVWLNVSFFVIFLFFAFSFFGYYELTLPASFTNKVSSAEGVGGVIGIFFMALTLALVSFSCTGPILGSLLAGALSSDGGAMQLTSGMAGFGVALALPFGMFAAFPSWMNSLPKSGGWLNTVKVVLGFLELALAFKFLSNADLVKHWGLLKIEPFLLIWIGIFALMGAYLMGWIRFPHDSPMKKLSPTRGLIGALTLAFVLYLMTGFRYNEETKTFTSLSLLSGLAPPVGYSWLYPNDCPQNLLCFHDLQEGMAYAQKNDKPVFLDFTGYACVNCRKMEEHVWPQEQVLSKLKNDYVVISLYVDDKKELPVDQQIEVTQVTGSKRVLKNYGHKWAHFQATYFNNNSQPYYVLLSPDGEMLNQPVGYLTNPSEFAAFLQCGLDAFQNK
jgi:thiol:disulfide interchange protein